MSTATAADAPRWSPAAAAVLACFGLSVLIVLVYVISLVKRAISSLSSNGTSRSSKTSKAAAIKPSKDSSAKAAAAAPAEDRQQQGKARGPDLKTLIKQAEKAKKSVTTKEDLAAHNALFITTLKGHGDEITGIAWSPDAKLFATACADMHVRLYDIHDLKGKDPKFRFLRTQYPPLGVGFGNEGNRMVVAVRGIPDLVHLVQYSPQRSKAGEAPQWVPDWQKEKVLGKEALLDFEVLPAGQTAYHAGVAVLLSSKKDGRVFSIANGQQLATFEPNSLGNHRLAVSGDGRFIGVASFTAEVKVWELEYGRDGFKGAPKVMDLKGHSSQVMAVAFSPDGTRAITASKDATLRIWKTDVRYGLREDPKTLLVVPSPLPKDQVFERLAWGPDGTIAAAHSTHVHFLSSQTGEVLEVVHAHEAPLTGMHWAPQRVPLVDAAHPVAVLATCSSDRRVRFWRSPAPAEED